jgi:UDP-N-acetylmuramoylalanine--D-glutamate ligase
MDACTSSLGLLGGESLLVLGLGDSGLAMARWCVAEGAAAVAVWDSRDSAPQDAQLAAELPQVQRQRGAQPALPPQCTRVLKSPGLAPHDARIADVLGAGLPVQGELGLFAQALAHLKREWRYEPAVLAITGTNGKTTTTALTGQLCEAAGRRVAVAGNIGPTLLDTLRAALLAEGPRPQVELALEPGGRRTANPAGRRLRCRTRLWRRLRTGSMRRQPADARGRCEDPFRACRSSSSTRCSTPMPCPSTRHRRARPSSKRCRRSGCWSCRASSSMAGSGEEGFEPTAATVLNLSQDHLDWHGDMAAYAAAKAGVFGQRR